MKKRISILSPLNELNELYILKDAGAMEVYCGYVPEYWFDSFNKVIEKDTEYFQVGINKRDVKRANISSYRELCRLVKEAEKLDMEVFLTVNAAFYPYQAYPLLKRYLSEVRQAGISNVIVSDIGLMRLISEEYPELRITVSCLAQTLNTYSVYFFQQFSPRRIVFPRHISEAEIIGIVKKFPEIEFEIFVLSDKCIYDDGSCRCHHDIGTICMDPWNGDFFECESAENSHVVLCEEKDEEVFRRWTRNYPNSKGVHRTFGNIGCSLCSLPSLLKYSNLNSLKIVGRGKSTEIKCELVKIAAQGIEMALKGDSREMIRKYVSEKLPYNKDMCVSNRYCIIRGK